MSDQRVAVIGGGVGGLVAAGLLAKRGRPVVLFEQHQQLGGKAGRVERNGLWFDTGPTLLALPHLVQSVFDELSVEMPKLHRLQTQCVYHFASGRELVVHEELGQTLSSARAFGSDAEAGLARFYQRAEEIYELAGPPYLDAPFVSVFEFVRRLWRRGGAKGVISGAALGTLDDLARDCVSSAELQQFIGRFATYVGASPFRASATYAMIAHIERRFGVFHPEGGMGELARRLAEQVRTLGVEVRLGEAVTHAPAGSGFVVRSSRGEEAFSQLIVNVDPWHEAPGPKRASTELSMSGYVLWVEVPHELRLPHHSILFSSDYASEFQQIFSGVVPSEPTLYLCHPAASDPTMAVAGRTGVYVMANMPAWAGASPFPSAALREHILRRIEPVLGRGLSIVGERTPSDFAALGAPHGSLYGAVGHGRLGPFGRPRMRSLVRGKYFVGGGTHPGGGVPMVAQSGRFAAELLLQDGGR